MKKKELPLVPLRDVVLFPNIVIPIDVGRSSSILAVEKAMKDKTNIILTTQKTPEEESPSFQDLYNVGTSAKVLQVLKLPMYSLRILVNSHQKVKIESAREKGSFLLANYSPIIEPQVEVDDEMKATIRVILNNFRDYVGKTSKLPSELLADIEKIENPNHMLDNIIYRLQLDLATKQSFLEMTSFKQRVEKLFKVLDEEISILDMEKTIRTRVKSQMEKTQREYYLNEKMRAIQKELGGSSEGGKESDQLQEKIEKSRLTEAARERVDEEYKKLKSMSPMSAEATVIRNYIDWILAIPWKKKTKINYDITTAKKVLDKEHYGLEDVKERILEHLAVSARIKSKHIKNRSTILCFVGPPGVGKTSLGKSIATATKRHFARMSLGGVRDEAEIRGHRRTYIGAMPGRIIQTMKKVKATNPLFLLDEIDKISYDYRGDPSSALLEVLDPEQNSTFADHYLELEYDLSKVMFIVTANTLNIPPALLDRLEIIKLSGYTEDEKLEIAKRHLIPKLKISNVIRDDEFNITDKAIIALIRNYTKEAGVRNVERELDKIMRKIVRSHIDKKSTAKVTITEKNLSKYAGILKYRYERYVEDETIGITNGLAWTGVGGEILTIEAVSYPGAGRFSQTGKLGDVMKESIFAAQNYIKSHAPELGLNVKQIAKTDIHIHVPEGATPKDGPSAGVAMISSIVSALTNIPIKSDLAMTGEITLRGRVLPIGGLKEKLLAAARGNIKTVLIPEENALELTEIPDNIKNKLEIIPIRTVTEVLKHCLTKRLKPIIWNEDDEAIASAGIFSSDLYKEDKNLSKKHN